MNRFRRICTAAIISLLAGWISLPGYTQDTYPKPVSEYAEETAPGTMVFLSYPKYYKNAEGKLAEVNTSLLSSTDPAYDYEVTQGIWQLKVRKDGTFQAEHEGDVFTYKFNTLGTGRGSGFKPFELGEADFSRFIVTGGTIRWSDVYKDIDLSVRYIHDILKVDVIVKNAFMADLKAETKAGDLNKNDYLTARFDIPQVLITSKAKQNGKDKDLYAEALDVEQPVYFVKDGRTVHKLLPVDTYLLDAKGEPINSLVRPVRTKQLWNLNKNGIGIAEMSAYLADLVDQPDGDVVIDPTTSFNSSKDTSLDYQTSTPYGSSQSLHWYYDHGRLLFGFDVTGLGSGQKVVAANLQLYVLSSNLSSLAQAKAYPVTTTWDESTATWLYYAYNYPWSQGSGGDFNSSVSGATMYINPSSLFSSGPATINVTDPFMTHYVNNIYDVNNKGFLLKINSNVSGGLYVATSNYSGTDYVNRRPKLFVAYDCGCDTTGGYGSTLNYKFNVYISPGAVNYLGSYGGLNKIYSTASQGESVIRNGHDQVPAQWDATADVSYSINNITQISQQDMAAYNLVDEIITDADFDAWIYYLCLKSPGFVTVGIPQSAPWGGFALLGSFSSQIPDKSPFRVGIVLPSTTIAFNDSGVYWSHELGHCVGSFLDMNDDVYDSTCPYNIMNYHMLGYHGLIQDQANAFLRCGERDGCPKPNDCLFTQQVICPEGYVSCQ